MASDLAMIGNLRHLRDLFHDGTATGLGDGQLLARYARNRDEAAFAALVARHGPMVLATCRAVLHREHDVEDAFQAAFLVLAREARSVRAGDALGGWLHRVAYRVAVRAAAEARRRRRREAEASAMAATTESRSGPEPDVASVIHEEVDRLPETLRLPVVLCDLEGLTYEEAAGRLRWSEPTLRCRLARARQKLHGRLTRRGLGTVALGSVLAGSSAGARAAVPDAMARAAVAAATTGAASTSAAALSAAIRRGLLLTRLMHAAAGGTAAAALIAIGLAAIRSGQTDEPGPPARATGAAVKPPAAPQEADAGAPVEVRGRVVGPDDRPIAGATLRIAYVEPVDPDGATSGPDGRFLLRVPRSVRSAPILLNGDGEFPWLIATAPGFGPAWIRGLLKSADPGERTIRLAPDGPPIEGRIVDLEGRPVAGASVRAVLAFTAAEGDLNDWLAATRARRTSVIRRDLAQWPLMGPAVTTDRDGRFRLAGLGRDRLARLSISGPTIATAEILAMNGDGDEIRARDAAGEPGTSMVIHPRRFQYAAAPTRPVEGTVRDKDTGQPIAGLTLHASPADDPRSLAPLDGIAAVTDAQGRYRLVGLPKASAYLLAIEQADGKPYLRTSFRIKSGSPTLEPVRSDVALKRGIPIRGKVTDKSTGRPAPGYIQLYVFRDNPALKEFPGLGAYNNLATALIKEDGRFEVVGLPGRNVLACRSEMRRYRGPLGAETIPGYDPRRMALDTVPLNCYVNNYHLLAEIDIDPGAEAATRDLQLDPGRSITLNVVDPEGQPIGGTKVKGVTDLFPDALEYEQPSPTIEVHALDPSKPRRVLVTHPGRKLIAAAYLKGDEPGPLALRLAPWGTITGRIVDEDGLPRRDLSLSNLGGTYPPPPADRGILPGDVWTNPVGRFRIERIVPGLKYAASAGQRSVVLGEVFRDVTVAPGEVKDLGDRKVVSHE